MVDWQGLLKFSLKYSDGTKESNFTEMTLQNKKWLEEALAHYCNSQIQAIQNILKQLQEPQKQQDEKYRISLMEQLQDLLDSLDKGNVIYKLNGHITLLKIVFYSKFSSTKILALQILSSCNQNQSMVQTQSINSGAFELIETILQQKNTKVVEAMLALISSIVRGQNMQAKRIFIKCKGLKVLKTLIESHDSQRLRNKIFVLLKDLIFYDDRLHLSFNDLTSFTNTNNIKLTEQDLAKKSQKNSLYYDVNEKYKNNNELEQNKQFKGCIKQYLKSQQGQQLRKIYEQLLEKEKHQNKQ